MGIAVGYGVWAKELPADAPDAPNTPKRHRPSAPVSREQDMRARRWGPSDAKGSGVKADLPLSGKELEVLGDEYQHPWGTGTVVVKLSRAEARMVARRRLA